MNKRIIFRSVILIAGIMLSQIGCATMPEATGAENDKSAAAVRAVLDAQVAAWNRGDIEEFMKGYERAETIVFVSGDNVTRGWQTVMDRYRKNYGSREKMGTLAFTELEIKPLSPFYATAVGRWQLTRAGDTPHGRFTLIFRRTTDGWRIVHDHTSSAQ
ncbi:MAG TPA: nuclear transport factor 2 family protein [Pyrinomonadaceae bacterium]|nr:nuclear transport factor 2 family protein [Pyrinomonadaceae bacterium]